MKRIFRFRFDEPDRDRYGEGPFEIDVATEALERVPLGLLEEFDDTTGMRVLGDWLDRFGQRDIKAFRAMMWLAYRLNRPDDQVAFGEFTPSVVAVANFDRGLCEFIAEGEPEGGPGNLPGPNRATRRAATKRQPSAKSSSGPK